MNSAANEVRSDNDASPFETRSVGPLLRVRFVWF